MLPSAAVEFEGWDFPSLSFALRYVGVSGCSGLAGGITWNVRDSVGMGSYDGEKPEVREIATPSRMGVFVVSW